MNRRPRGTERLGRLVLAVLMIVAGVAVALPASSVAEGPASTPSAVTVRGTGKFASLAFTASQTRDLINQTVHLSWTGAAPTDANRGYNYLQIMQCWGDDPTGPRREQCQYGVPQGSYDSSAMFSRGLIYSDLLKDPLETQPQQTEKPGMGTYVPFTPASPTDPATKPWEPGYGLYFDASSTNEVQQAVTREDGTGEIDFEVQTMLEASGLECGRVRTTGADTGKPRHCWLVVVPRGDTEVNGAKVGTPGAGGHYHNYLDTSPLSATNWANRMVVRLDFLPVGESCAIGRAERPLNGHEFIADAVQRWQPALCAGNGPVFGFVQMGDRAARAQLASGEPGMVFLSKPATEQPATEPAVYAPVGISAYTIAFVMEKQPSIAAPPDDYKNSGQLIRELNLTPRLVAKLLTQSYSDAVPGAQEYLAGNPVRLVRDKEFLQLNPEFDVNGFSMLTIDALASSVDSDATADLWAWIGADPEARDFLNGKPDPWGMKVNKNYLNLELPLENFPKADTTCIDVKFGDLVAPICATTRHPLVADMHEAGRSANRGDSMGREPNGQRDPLDLTRPAFGRIGRQPIGRRAMLAVVDKATADRYGLFTAKLRNASGKFVAPSAENILAGVAEMTPTKTDGVKGVNVTPKAANAYPLPMVTYAVTAPAAITADAGKDYATLLRFVTGKGQTPGEGTGQLPSGYVPLPQAMREQALATATTVEKTAGKKITVPTEGVDPDPAPDAGDGGGTDSGAGGGDGGDSGTGGGGTGTGGQGGGDTAPAAGQTPQTAAPPAAEKPTDDTSKPVADTRTTPASPVGWFLKYLLVLLLVAGGLAAGGGPVLSILGSRRRKP
ncbi:hypothetical protein V5P93_001265 [Actinokineospora auranticolor]|uniref:PBP domain-containing protein n=1 Tax=Actinokineospora auranticolor TaxID=155976 RepID=A0A2S6GUM2_9PSEU|nr:hypothetical protein [Actinokineospora auranticolor]PPK68893.1 hypothetical protein CLV40_104137 [Actinokineospora auranticolor]